MMKKLKWVTIVWILIALIGGWYVMQRNVRLNYEDAKERNYLRAEVDRDIENRLEKIQFEHIEFTDDITLRQALNFLALRLRESDPPSPLSAKLVECRKGLPDEVKQKIIGKLKLKEVSYAEALDVLFLRVGLTWEIVNGDLVVEEIK